MSRILNGGQSYHLIVTTKTFNFYLKYGLKRHFGGQKESFKKILGPILGFFCCYYNWLPWPDPKTKTLIRTKGF
jgi:hypothetical protein